MTHARGHGELYDGVARRSGSLLIGGLVGSAQELPFPGQQFVQMRSGKIGDTGEDVGASQALGSTSLRRQVVIIVSEGTNVPLKSRFARLRIAHREEPAPEI